MSSKKVMTIFGTRPEAIKMAPLVKELEARSGLESICCVTAQHREMLDSVLEIFGITPQYDLNIMEPGQTLSTITSKCLLGMEGVLKEAKPDLILVHGDMSPPASGSSTRPESSSSTSAKMGVAQDKSIMSARSKQRNFRSVFIGFLLYFFRFF